MIKLQVLADGVVQADADFKGLVDIVRNAAGALSPYRSLPPNVPVYTIVAIDHERIGQIQRNEASPDELVVARVMLSLTPFSQEAQAGALAGDGAKVIEFPRKPQ